MATFLRVLRCLWASSLVLLLCSGSWDSPLVVHGFQPSSFRAAPTRSARTPLSSAASPPAPPPAKKSLRERLGLRRRPPKAEAPVYRVTTVDELEPYWADEEQRFRRNDKSNSIDYTALLKALSVIGDTQHLGAPETADYTHPVAHVIHQRLGQPLPQPSDLDAAGRRKSDGCRIALAVEGGGMRGCVSAGMICALGHLNMTSAFDVIYGSSAGTIVGAYAVTNQLKWFGPEVYYDILTTAGKVFIDNSRLFRALGLGLLNPRLYKDMITRRRDGKPVLNLKFLLKTTMQDKKPLDWDTFVERQTVQPLKVVASALKSEKAVVMEMATGHFTTLEEMADCMHASCLLPGVAGPIMNLNTKALGSNPTDGPKMVLGNHLKGGDYEPLADALVYEPLPYRSALTENCTHVVVIRSRPDGTDVSGKSSIFEKLIFRRFFLRKNKLPRIFEYFRKQLHKKLYAEDILRLNAESKSTRDPYDLSQPHILAVAAPPGSPEVTRLEVGREAIFSGFRRGFARCYDCLVPDPAERGWGIQVAEEYFPDEILDYDPLEIDSIDESAFSLYMRANKVTPKSWKRSQEKAEKNTA